VINCSPSTPATAPSSVCCRQPAVPSTPRPAAPSKAARFRSGYADAAIRADRLRRRAGILRPANPCPDCESAAKSPSQVGPASPELC